ncbi:PhzF family phenazine biosynthesis protein [Flexithrix dorotheae]|uniref:PhzF family phenazine biosynthesis protein n=1 Tax=Flexithrix dorotheae TaxID=70993 RepID=UPI00036304A1|nr:PhzF family phenazine biosynthesis protein [Flexithrix dorotheae]
MKIKTYQIDAFTNQPFKGNPAGVCVLEEPLEESLMQSIAAEMNLSETAFFYPILNDPDYPEDFYNLRFFTPTVEIPLCGHATLATSKLLFHLKKVTSGEIRFKTQRGILTIAEQEGKIEMDFPLDELVDCTPSEELLKVLGLKKVVDSKFGVNTNFLLLRVEDVETVKQIQPDYGQLLNISAGIDLEAVIVTSTGNAPFDFSSRVFGPWVGIDEDPVTGSAHTVLGPYYAEVLNKKTLNALQCSERTGELGLSITENNRIKIRGEAVIVLGGYLNI